MGIVYPRVMLPPEPPLVDDLLSTPAAPPRPVDSRILELVEDPLAYVVFSVTTEAGAGTASAIAEFLGERQEDVAQRLVALERHGLVEAVGEPGSETAYRPTRDAMFTDDEYAAFTPEQRRTLFTMGLERMQARIGTSLADGGFDAHDTHVSWLPLDLDREGYDEAVRLTLATFERARDIQAGVVDRRVAGTSEGGDVRTDLMLLHFQRSSSGPTAAPARAATDLRERTYALADHIADAVAVHEPDWQVLAARAHELAALAQRLAATPRSART